MRRMTIDRQPASLYEPVEYVLSIGGKRVRPVLTLLATIFTVKILNA